MAPRKTPESAQIDARIAEMRATRTPYRIIAAELGMTHQAVWERYTRLLKGIPDSKVIELRREETEQLDALEHELLAALDKDYPLIQGGKVVQRVVAQVPILGPDGQPVVDADGSQQVQVFYEPVMDYGAKLAILDRIMRLKQRRALLLGLDAPVQIEHSGELTLTQGTESVDDEIARLERELAQNDPPRQEAGASESP